MTDKKKMNAELKIRCTSEEKETIKRSAEEVGLSMSDFIRSLVFGKEKLILLSDGSEIAKALFLTHTDLEYFRSNGGIPKESARAITEALNDVSAQLNAVAAKLTDIHSNSEGVDSDE